MPVYLIELRLLAGIAELSPKFRTQFQLVKDLLGLAKHSNISITLPPYASCQLKCVTVQELEKSESELYVSMATLRYSLALPDPLQYIGQRHVTHVCNIADVIVTICLNKLACDPPCYVRYLFRLWTVL